MLKMAIRAGFMESPLFLPTLRTALNRAAVVGWNESRRDGSTINKKYEDFFALRAVVDPLRLIHRLVLVHGKPLVSSDTAHGP